MIKIANKRVLVSFILATMVCLAACSSDGGQTDEDEPIVIEPGVVNEDNTPDEETPVVDTPEEEFVDKGEETTIDDLVAAQEKITSYYFEQTIPYAYGSVSLNVWYADNKMKVVANSASGEINESYYDYDEMTMIYYNPAEGNQAIKMDFNPNSEDAPDNPKDENYAACTLLGKEELEGQLCYILQTAIGDKLWVSTKYGFPMQVEFVDHLGDTYTVAYHNIEINTISAAEVAIPDNVAVSYLGSGSELQMAKYD